MQVQSMKIEQVQSMGIEVTNLDLYGDVLESVVTRVPSIDLIQASLVSHEWRSAVFSSLHQHPRRLPWLIIRHLQKTNSPSFRIHAFDSNSSTWISLPQEKHSETTQNILAGSKGDRLYSLSLSKIVISDDLFGVKGGTEMKGTKVWRPDPVVADLGNWVVLAGGGCPMMLDDDEMGSVEIYDKQSKVWQSAESMPVQFDGSMSAIWLSTAVSSNKLFVMDKKTGFLSCFNPESKKWGCLRKLNPESYQLSSWCITTGRNERLMLLGVGEERGVEGTNKEMKVKVYEMEVGIEVNNNNRCEEMPKEMVKRLFPCDEGGDDTWQGCTAEIKGTEYGGYVYNSSQVSNGVVFYELAEVKEKRRIVKRWEWVPLSERLGDDLMMGRVVIGCSAVGLGELAGLRVN